MSRSMTRQRDDLHAVDDWLRATKRAPLIGLDVRRSDGLRTLEERLRILGRMPRTSVLCVPNLLSSARNYDASTTADTPVHYPP
jgi:hypothetical protein